MKIIGRGARSRVHTGGLATLEAAEIVKYTHGGEGS